MPLAELGVPLTLAEEKLLQQHVRVAIHNAPCSTDVHLATTTVYAAADACNDHVRKDGVKVSGGGWVLYGAAYVVGSHDYLADRCAWGGEWLDQAIHILEAQAVLELLKWMPPAPALTRLLLGEDNTIVVAALNNGYSSCVKTRHIVKEILAEAKKKRYLIVAIWIPTKENAADPVSRDEEMDEYRTERTWRILHGEAPQTAKTGKRERVPPKSMDHSAENPHAQELEVAICCLDDEE